METVLQQLKKCAQSPNFESSQMSCNDRTLETDVNDYHLHYLS